MPEQNFTEDQKAIERRRKIADMLMSQSQAPLESMGTAGGAPIPISWTQGLEKLMKAYMGSKGAERADIESKTLEDNRRKALVEAIQQAPGTIQTQQRMIGSPSDIDIGTITQKALQPQQSGLLGMGEMIEKNIQPPVTTRRPDDLTSQIAYAEKIRGIDPSALPVVTAYQTREDTQAAAREKAAADREAKLEAARLLAEQRQRDNEFKDAMLGKKLGSAEKISDKKISASLEKAAIQKPLTAAQQLKEDDKIAKAYAGAETTFQKMNEVIGDISNIKGSKGLEARTGLSGYVPAQLQGENARIAEQRINSLKGKMTIIGKEMASATGAIGPMAVQEWGIVRDAVEALDPTAGNFNEQMQKVEELAQQKIEIIKDLYDRQFSSEYERLPQYNVENIGKRRTPSGNAPTSVPSGFKPL